LNSGRLHFENFERLIDRRNREFKGRYLSLLEIHGLRPLGRFEDAMAIDFA